MNVFLLFCASHLRQCPHLKVATLPEYTNQSSDSRLNHLCQQVDFLNIRTNNHFVERIYFFFFLNVGEDGNKHSGLFFFHMHFEPVIVSISGNSDAFIVFQKEMGLFLDAGRSISTIPPLCK